MLHPSYADLMKVVNSEVEAGEAPVVNSRYSIVMATAKRARQIIDEQKAAAELNNGMVTANAPVKKPLSIAIEELEQGKIHILNDEE